MTVKKRGGRWQVISSTKGVVGTHPTKKEALAQHAVIMISKKKRGKGK